MKTLLNENTTEQDLFNHVAAHLLTQRVESRKGSSQVCQYRGDNGLSCAIGSCISNEDYKESMEGEDAETLIKKYFPRAYDLIEICNRLQTIHDLATLDDWKVDLQQLAKTCQLDASILDGFDAIESEL